MGFIKPSNEVVFADERIREAWIKVNETDLELAKQLLKAKQDILENAFCGIQIQKGLIPKEYFQKFGINNLWKYNLSNAWRLLYSITTPSKVEIISVVLDWMSHKDYENLFGY